MATWKCDRLYIYSIWISIYWRSNLGNKENWFEFYFTNKLLHFRFYSNIRHQNCDLWVRVYSSADLSLSLCVCMWQWEKMQESDAESQPPQATAPAAKAWTPDLVELILDDIGGSFKKYQIINYILFCIPFALSGSFGLSYVFTALNVEYR